MKRILTTLSQKWPEYLLEIIVITVGILGAFALNNWSLNQIAKKEEVVVLKGLKEEFQQNLEELANDHYLNKVSLKATRELLQRNGESTPGHVVDSLFGHILNWATFDPRVSVSEEVISSGKLGTIQDEKLRYLLTQWSGELNDLREDIAIRRDHYLLVLLPQHGKFVSSRNSDNTLQRTDYPRELLIDPIAYDQSVYDAMLSSSEFDDALYVQFLSQSFVFINEESIKSYIDEILAMIDENLKDK